MPYLQRKPPLRMHACLEKAPTDWIEESLDLNGDGMRASGAQVLQLRDSDHESLEGAPELLYIGFTRKEQTSLPALVLKGKSTNYNDFNRILEGF